MKKKTVSIFLALAMLLTLIVPSCAAGADFVDVPETAWYHEAVRYMADSGLMSGTGEDTFSPEQATSRAMLVTVLWRQARQPEVTQSAAFPDTDANTWYSDALSWAVERGVVTGYGNGKFGPNDPVSREQLATILWRMAGSPEVENTEPFSDQAVISGYAGKAVAWARAEGIVSGKGGNTFDPLGSASRAEMAAIVYRRAQTQTPEPTPSPEPTAAPAPTPAPTRRPSGGGGGSHSGGGGSSGGGSSSAPKPTPKPEPTPSPEPTPVDPGPDSNAKVLVTYFSATNNTEAIAGHITYALGADTADLYEIVPATPYTSADLDYTDPSSRSQVEQNDAGARPAIVSTVSNLSDYDVVFLGYPIWNGKAPKVLYTFLESCGDWSGKTIVPFCTSGSSPIGSSADDLHALVSNDANWLDGRRFSSGASRETVAAWVDGLGLNLNPDEEDVSMNKITVSFGGHSYAATLEDSSSALAFAQLLESKGGSMTIHMSEYGGWEKVGSLGQTLPSSDTQTTTAAGDFVLYSGDQIVLFYGSNSWSYTRLGCLDDPTGLRDALGGGDVDITFALAK